MKVYNKEFLTATVLNTDISGPAMEVYQMFGFCVVAIVTGTPTGTISLEASNDPFRDQDTTYVPTNWNEIDDSSFTLSTAGLTTWNYNGAFFNYVRLKYVDGSAGASTATVKLIINSKG